MRNKLAKNSIAVGLVTLIITAGLSFSAQAAPGDISQSNSKAVKGTGLFGNSGLDLDGGQCDAKNPVGAAPIDQRCGPGLDTTGIDAYDQEATANADGTSNANASVAPIDIEDFTSIDITDLLNDITGINTLTILDPIIQGLDPVTKGIVLTALAPLLNPIDDAVQAALAQVENQLDVSINIGLVEATCSATPTSAEGNGTVADIDVDLQLGDGGPVVNVPITLATTPNSNLIVNSDEAAQQIVDDIIDGLVATFETSLGGNLAALNAVLTTLGSSVHDLLDGLEQPLLTPLGIALEPLVSGTVNVQTPVSPTTDAIDVTALHLAILRNNVLELARVTCGPNNAAANDNDAQAANDNDNDNDTQAANDNDNDTQAANDNDNDSDSDEQSDSDAASDSDSQADADVTTTLPATGSPNLLPFWMLGLGLLLFGATVLLNEKRRFQI